MKKGIHPQYAPVAFRDRSGGLVFLTSSTATSDSTLEIDGQDYPVIDVEVSTASHPYWTGKGRVLDAEGRVQRFERRYGTKA